jgi:mercuric ion binding protein
MVSTPEAGQPALTENHEPKQANWVAAGALIGAGLASACCVVPLLLVMLGISGAWIANLTALEPYKPYVAGVTLALGSATASGMSISSRNRPVKTVPTALVHNRLGPPRRCCGWALPSPSRRSPSTGGHPVLLKGNTHEKTVCIAMAVLAMAGGGVAYAVSGTAQDRPAATATAQKQTTFAIENMTCATCPITVKKAMEGVAGVTAVTVDFAAKTARATYDPRRTNAAAIAAASTNAGYPARAAIQN